MGTNYYVRTDRCTNGCEHCSASDGLHLGKSSVGWRFLHRAEPDWPRDQAQSRWLEGAAQGKIYTEYGEVVTLDELLAFIDRKQQEDRSQASFTSNGYDFCDRPFS